MDLLSVNVDQLEGRVNSKAPKNEKAKITKTKKKKTFVIQCVEISYKIFPLFTIVKTTPNRKNITTILSDYNEATLTPAFLSFDLLRKKLTVIGNIANTQGVIIDAKPPPMP